MANDNGVGPVTSSGDVPLSTIVRAMADDIVRVSNVSDLQTRHPTEGRVAEVTDTTLASDEELYIGDGSQWIQVDADSGMDAPSVKAGKLSINTYGKIQDADPEDEQFAIVKQTDINGSLVWEFSDPSGRVRSSPTVVDGVLYVGSDDNSVYAVDTSDGSLVWEFSDPSGSVFSSPTVVDGVLYVGSDDSSVYAVSAVERFARMYVADAYGWVPLHKGPNEITRPAGSTQTGNYAPISEDFNQ